MAALGWLAFATVWLLIAAGGGGIRAVFALAPVITAMVISLFPKGFGLIEQALICVLALGTMAAIEALIAHIQEIRSQRDGRTPPPVHVRLPPPKEVPLSAKALRLQRQEAFERRRRGRDDDDMALSSTRGDGPSSQHHHGHNASDSDSDD